MRKDDATLTQGGIEKVQVSVRSSSPSRSMVPGSDRRENKPMRPSRPEGGRRDVKLDDNQSPKWKWTTEREGGDGPEVLTSCSYCCCRWACLPGSVPVTHGPGAGSWPAADSTPVHQPCGCQRTVCCRFRSRKGPETRFGIFCNNSNNWKGMTIHCGPPRVTRLVPASVSGKCYEATV